METAIQIFAVLNFGVLGVSHVVQHRAWAEWFVWLSELGRPGVFLNAATHFLIGTLVVSFHNVWSGLPLLLTLAGWGWTAKGALYLCAPAVGLWSMRRISVERSRQFIVAGLLLIAIAAVLGWQLATAR